MPRYDTRNDCRGKAGCKGLKRESGMDAMGSGSGEVSQNVASSYGYLLRGQDITSARNQVAGGLPPSEPSSQAPDLYGDHATPSGADDLLGEGARTQAAKALAKKFLKAAATAIKKYGQKAAALIKAKLPEIIKLAKENKSTIAAFAISKGLPEEIADLLESFVPDAEGQGGSGEVMFKIKKKAPKTISAAEQKRVVKRLEKKLPKTK